MFNKIIYYKNMSLKVDYNKKVLVTIIVFTTEQDNQRSWLLHAFDELFFDSLKSAYRAAGIIDDLSGSLYCNTCAIVNPN